MSSPKVLYDAKYKAPGATPSADDVYQMVTYCERLGLDEAILVHPGTGHAATATIGNRHIQTLQLCVVDAKSVHLG